MNKLGRYILEFSVLVLYVWLLTFWDFISTRNVVFLHFLSIVLLSFLRKELNLTFIPWLKWSTYILVTFLCILFAREWRYKTNLQRGVQIVRALENYHQKYEIYPKTQEELTPTFLPKQLYYYGNFGQTMPFFYKFQDSTGYELYFKYGAGFYTFTSTKGIWRRTFNNDKQEEK